MNSNIQIYLIQPLRKTEYKEIIVYTDTEQEARNAAALIKNPERLSISENPLPPETVYLDRGMSICIKVEPTILKVDPDLQSVQIKYNEVSYNLEKNIAAIVKSETFF